MNPFIAWFDQEFKALESDWRASIAQLDQLKLYSASEQPLPPAAEQILRSARIVEQTFGGITANLWDDPFEWTLPETLTTKDKLIGYLDEVRDTCERGFRRFQNDQDLLKSIMTPQGPTQLMSILLDSLLRAGHHNLRARECLRK